MSGSSPREPRPGLRRPVRWIPLAVLVTVILMPRVVLGARPPAVGALVYDDFDGTTKRSRIYTVTPGEATHRVVYDQPGIVTQVKWSPDGSQIAFYDDGIWVMNADGSDVRKLVDGKFRTRMGHTWGPEDGQITFYEPTSEKTGELLVMDVRNPDNQRFLWEGDRVAYAPAWSPDRTRLAFCVRVGRNPLDIYVLDADTRSVARLTHDAYARDVAWSPNGKRLVYAAWTEDPFNDARGGSFSNVFVMDAREGAAPRLVTGGVQPSHPCVARRWAVDRVRALRRCACRACGQW